MKEMLPKDALAQSREEIYAGMRRPGIEGKQMYKTLIAFIGEPANQLILSTIHGGVTISGYNGFWMGFIRNHVLGSVKLNGNVLVDPDGNEYVTNSIHGNLKCSGDSPAPQIGDSEGSPNAVTGVKTGQCAHV